MRIRDGDSSDPGSGMEKSRIRDKHPGSATLNSKYVTKGFNQKNMEQQVCRKGLTRKPRMRK